MQMQAEDIFTPQLVDSGFDSNFASAAAVTNPSILDNWEPPSFQSSAIFQAMMGKAISLDLSALEQAEISQHLNFLFTPSRITKMENLYFEFWHPHCRILHQVSFSIENAPTPLLVAVIAMGAMYSQVDQEATTAKGLLDLAELYIYSTDILTEEFEIR